MTETQEYERGNLEIKRFSILYFGVEVMGGGPVTCGRHRDALAWH